MNETRHEGSLVARAWSYLRQAWLVILLALLYGGALAGVQATLGPRIDANKQNETYDRIPNLVPGADREKSVQVNLAEADKLKVSGADGKEQRVYRALAADGSPKGWVLPASGLGFADRIDLLIGLNPALSTITGLYVLDQKETPGLGNNITKEDLFLRHFAGKSADKDLEIVKTAPAPNSNQIPALSGATISSVSVAEIVNKAIQNFREPIRQLPPAPAAPPPTLPRKTGG